MTNVNGFRSICSTVKEVKNKRNNIRNHAGKLGELSTLRLRVLQKVVKKEAPAMKERTQVRPGAPGHPTQSCVSICA